MAVALKYLMDECMDKYELKLIAGGSGVYAQTDWVYVAEDIENAGFINGKQLIITTGYFKISGLNIVDFIKTMIDRGESGIILNTGKYIFDEEITPEIRDICDREHFALYTMPCKVYITDLLQDICGRIFVMEKRNYSVSSAVKNAIMMPERKEDYEAELENAGFDESCLYRIICTDRMIQENVYVEIMRGINYHSVEYKNQTLIICEDFEGIIQITEEIACKANCTVGISIAITGVHNIALMYSQAYSAVRAAKIENESVAEYDKIGVMALIFAVKDRNLLENLYKSKLEPLEEYDRGHKLELIETLFYYLKTGGSLSETAKKLFTHRNTIGYRMNKIRELCGNSFDDARDRYDYLTAVYVKKFLEEY